jgi:hypothetical protein
MLEWKARILTLLIALGPIADLISSSVDNWNW